MLLYFAFKQKEQKILLYLALNDTIQKYHKDAKKKEFR